jgi:hypothetical protein
MPDLIAAEKPIHFQKRRTKNMMLKRYSAVALFGVALSGVIATGAQTSPFSAEAKQKAASLLKQMTLDEKVGQLNESSGRVLPGIAAMNACAVRDLYCMGCGEVLAMSRSVLIFDAVAFKLPPDSEYAGSVYLAERCS